MISDMKIALLTDTTAFAGTEQHILDLGIALRDLGCAVEIACPAAGLLSERARSAGVAHFPVEKSAWLGLGAIATLRRRLQAGELDIIHSHNGRTALIAAIAARLAGGGRTITTQHFLQPARTLRRGPIAWVAKRLHAWVLARAARVIAISGPVRDAILERGEAPASSVQTVWNGIADPLAAPLLPAAALRAGFGIPEGAPLAVCAARLEPEKQVGVLIDAFRTVAAALPQARCLIAGEGRQHAALQQQIDAAGLQSSVRLVGFRSDVLSLVHAGDVFALPSAAEPFGLALVEAMALRKPVIATRAGGPLEIVQEGESGLLVPASDPAALGGAILRVLQDAALAERLGAGGRARFERFFTAPRMAAELLSIYQAVLNS